MNPDHLESRTRTLGRPWRRREESAMLGEESDWRRGEASKQEEEEGRKKRGTQNPLYRWKPHPPKPLQLAGVPPPSERLELPQGTHRPPRGGARGGTRTIYHRAMEKLVLPNPPAL